MQIGGWKTRSVFERYNIVDERDIADAANRYDAFMVAESTINQESRQTGEQLVERTVS